MRFSHFLHRRYTQLPLLRQFFFAQNKKNTFKCAQNLNNEECSASKSATFVPLPSVPSDTGFIFHSFEFVAQIAKEGT